MKKLDRGGFTMVELLIVLAIIAILAAVAIPVYSSQLEASRKKVDESNLRAATGIAAQDYIVRNAGSTQAAGDKDYGVFVLDGGTAQGDAKNMLVYPLGVKINNQGEEVESGAGTFDIPRALPGDAAGAQRPLGYQVQSKDLKWYPVQQNGGKGTFEIQIGENGVVKKSTIKTLS